MSMVCDVEQHFVFDKRPLMASIHGRVIPLARVSPTHCSPDCIIRSTAAFLNA